MSNLHLAWFSNSGRRLWYRLRQAVSALAPAHKSLPPRRKSRLAENGSVAYVAQLVEHFLGKEEVAGSIPFVGSKAQANAHIRTLHNTNTNLIRFPSYGKRIIQS